MLIRNNGHTLGRTITDPDNTAGTPGLEVQWSWVPLHTNNLLPASDHRPLGFLFITAAASTGAGRLLGYGVALSLPGEALSLGLACLTIRSSVTITAPIYRSPVIVLIAFNIPGASLALRIVQMLSSVLGKEMFIM